MRNPHNIPQFEGHKLYSRRDREDQNKLKFDLTENVVNSSDDDFKLPADEDSQGNIISINKMKRVLIRRRTRKTPSHHTRRKNNHHPRPKAKKNGWVKTTP
jgi:hypothetical protein